MTPDDIRHIVELAEAGKFREILGRYGERVIISGDAGEDYLEDPSAELTEICTISLMGEDESVEGAELIWSKDGKGTNGRYGTFGYTPKKTNAPSMNPKEAFEFLNWISIQIDKKEPPDYVIDQEGEWGGVVVKLGAEIFEICKDGRYTFRYGPYEEISAKWVGGENFGGYYMIWAGCYEPDPDADEEHDSCVIRGEPWETFFADIRKERQLYQSTPEFKRRKRVFEKFFEKEKQRLSELE